jgi:hypothetical protein
VVALAQDLRLVPVFETARMYTGAIPPLLLVLRESLRFGNISVHGRDRMDNLLKVHIL